MSGSQQVQSSFIFTGIFFSVYSNPVYYLNFRILQLPDRLSLNTEVLQLSANQLRDFLPSPPFEYP